MAKALFITGTDTEVGKTQVAVALLKALAQQGLSTVAMKPVAAGCEQTEEGLRNEDALLLQRSATVQLPYSQVNPIALKEACAPHIAAAKEGRRLSLSRIEGLCRGLLMQRVDVCVIEGAGGWRVPLNEQEMLSGLPLALQAPCVLVVGVRLGCINHALLTAEAIVRDGVPLVGWVANTLVEDAERSDEVAANIATLQAILPMPCLGVMPFIEGEPEARSVRMTGHIALEPLLKALNLEAR